MSRPSLFDRLMKTPSLADAATEFTDSLRECFSSAGIPRASRYKMDSVIVDIKKYFCQTDASEGVRSLYVIGGIHKGPPAPLTIAIIKGEKQVKATEALQGIGFNDITFTVCRDSNYVRVKLGLNEVCKSLNRIGEDLMQQEEEYKEEGHTSGPQSK